MVILLTNSVAPARPYQLTFDIMSQSIVLTNDTNGTNIFWQLHSSAGSGIASGTLGTGSGLPNEATVSGLDSGDYYNATMSQIGASFATFENVKPGQNVILSVEIE